MLHNHFFGGLSEPKYLLLVINKLKKKNSEIKIRGRKIVQSEQIRCLPSMEFDLDETVEKSIYWTSGFSQEISQNFEIIKFSDR